MNGKIWLLTICILVAQLSMQDKGNSFPVDMLLYVMDLTEEICSISIGAGMLNTMRQTICLHYAIHRLAVEIQIINTGKKPFFILNHHLTKQYVICTFLWRIITIITHSIPPFLI